MSTLAPLTMDGSLIYRKSGLGAAQLATDHGQALSPRERQVLILVNGRRTIAELADLLGADTVQRMIPDLEARGFAKLVDPNLDPDWAGAVTQFRLPDAESQGPAAALRMPRYPMVWIGLLAVLVALGTDWALHRFQRQLDSNWRFDPVPAQTLSIDPPAPSRTTAANNRVGSQRPAPGDITPITHRPAAIALEAAAVSPERVVSPARTHADRAIVAAAPIASPASAVPEPDQPAPGQLTRAQSTPVQSTPAAANPSIPVQAPPTQSPAAADSPTPVQTADAPRAAADSSTAVKTPDAPRAAADSSTPVKTPDARASATGTEIAVAASAAQAAGDTVRLRPLRHDPPQLPPQVLLNGFAEGHVRARLWVTPEGKVDQVDVLEATPPHVLDDEVRRALSLWTYDPPGQPAEDVVDLTVKR